MDTGTDVIRRYFELEAAHDLGALVALFGDDATVVDEGRMRRGVDEIRAWRSGAASAYTYSTEVRAIRERGPDQYLVDGRITGDFAGGVADLTWDFTVAEGRIHRLVIAP
jgi:ketosteroid isomerase-like protein